MHFAISILAVLCCVWGIIWSVAPILPGPLLSLGGIFLIERFTPQDWSREFLLLMSGLTVLTMLADYLLPILGTKQYGWSRAGVRWSTLGLIIWFFVFPPLWLLIGPLVGAFLGELRQKKNAHHARRAARGSFVGSSLSTFLKLIVCGIHTRYVMQTIR